MNPADAIARLRAPRDGTFTYHRRTLTYFEHLYNTTMLNERCVEIPVAQAWLDGRGGRGLEVGNVLGHYGVTGHRVVDLYEEADGVENLDLFDVTDRFDWIVAISTVEHVRWDSGPRDPEGSIDAVEHLRSLLNPGGGLLVTVPMGHQPHLDDVICGGGWADRAAWLVRTPYRGWRETRVPVRRPYGPWANSVWIGEFDR